MESSASCVPSETYVALTCGAAVRERGASSSGGLLLLIGLALLFTLIGALIGVVLMGAGLSLMLLSAL